MLKKKSNEIHQSQGDYSGDALHGNYTKHFITNELAEKGQFDYGVKINEWKRWFKNGQLKAVENYYNGKLSGAYLLYSDTGELLSSGRYNNNKKTGQWVDYVTNDTTYYRKGLVFNKKDSLGNAKEPFLKQVFKKKENTKTNTKKKTNTNRKKAKKKERINTSKRKTNKRRKPNAVRKPKKRKQPKKESFLKRLFSKKDKKNAKS